MSAPLPWQAEAWAQLSALRAAGRLPHALLLSGMSGTGVEEFAGALARRVLCSEGGAGEACGRCRACQLLAAGSHPDLMEVVPERTQGPIKVDQIREVVGFGQTTAQQGGRRVILICPAESMNVNAANSLLKTLEEPGEGTLLLLISHAAGAVLPTIRSRCQIVRLPIPGADIAGAWLADRIPDARAREFLGQLVSGQPLHALRLAPQEAALRKLAQSLLQLIDGQAGALEVAKGWVDFELDELLSWLYLWLSSACLATAVSPRDELSRQLCASWSARADITRLAQVVDGIVALRRQLLAGGNPNRQLLLESLALSLTARSHPGGSE